MRSKTMCLGLALIVFMSGLILYGSIITQNDQVYAQTPGSLPLVQLNNLVYQGAFRPPKDQPISSPLITVVVPLPITPLTIPSSWWGTTGISARRKSTSPLWSLALALVISIRQSFVRTLPMPRRAD